MNKKEVSQKYQIPVSILDEYESWGLCNVVKFVMGEWQYDDQDIERLSTIMALHDMGFKNNEIEKYMRLLLETKNSSDEIIQLLTKKRQNKLDQIHFQEKQLERIDYLRYKIKKSQEK
ncbi:MerR family transcriptional regulator [Companilactobacillus farciminis]|uniref:MerR family transcriptional regulator n=1 Tax=Companilactobacillus farciminis TaxID=1612 RepID=UPI00232ED9DB|nr:MerR family transcriptional regulator [Companilactobacillus farciminis]WCG36133.1 MerR family transcriptional regulator [Companilactobacillus farciminis]